MIKSRVRAGGLACGYGGEGISLILAEMDIEGAHKCVENIRQAIKYLALPNRGQRLGTVTISAGISTCPTHAGNADDLITRRRRGMVAGKEG